VSGRQLEIARSADTSFMTAFITVTDAAGRVLFRRPATEAEVMDALRAADTAEFEAQAAMDRIADERAYMESLEPDPA
jgi:hypothetical protein